MRVKIKYIDLKENRPLIMPVRGALLISGYIYVYEARVFGTTEPLGIFNLQNLIILN